MACTPAPAHATSSSCTATSSACAACAKGRRRCTRTFAELPPHCETCGALLRPGVVWFGEALPEEAVARAVGAIHNADVLLVIGTSGVVYPAAGFVTLHEGLSIEINPETSGVSSSCTFAIPARAAEATPAIVEALLEVRS